jgi:hypothetical protein
MIFIQVNAYGNFYADFILKRYGIMVFSKKEVKIFEALTLKMYENTCLTTIKII